MAKSKVTRIRSGAKGSAPRRLAALQVEVGRLREGAQALRQGVKALRLVVAAFEDDGDPTAEVKDVAAGLAVATEIIVRASDALGDLPVGSQVYKAVNALRLRLWDIEDVVTATKATLATGEFPVGLSTVCPIPGALKVAIALLGPLADDVDELRARCVVAPAKRQAA